MTGMRLEELDFDPPRRLASASPMSLIEKTAKRTRNTTKNFQDELAFKQTFSINSGQDDSVTSKGKKILSVFEKKEAEKKKLSESRNKLEALIYEVR